MRLRGQLLNIADETTQQMDQLPFGGEEWKPHILYYDFLAIPGLTPGYRIYGDRLTNKRINGRRDHK